MAHKEFVSSTPAIEEGPSFSVDGQKFHCLARPPHGFIADLVQARAGNFYSAAAMRNFIRGALVQEDEAAWDELQYAKDSTVGKVDVELLGDLFGYLVEEFFGRPTLPPSGSPDGRNETEATSTEGSPSPEAIPEASTT